MVDSRAMRSTASLLLLIALGAVWQSSAELVYPVDIIVDGDAWVIADFKGHGLFRLTADGDVSAKYSRCASGLSTSTTTARTPCKKLVAFTSSWQPSA